MEYQVNGREVTALDTTATLTVQNDTNTAYILFTIYTTNMDYDISNLHPFIIYQNPGATGRREKACTITATSTTMIKFRWDIDDTATYLDGTLVCQIAFCSGTSVINGTNDYLWQSLEFTVPIPESITGDALNDGTEQPLLIQVLAAASSAFTHEENAEASEINAKSSEVNAKASETNAALSASAASKSAEDAKASETNAALSASAAAQSANNAKNSETAAKASETAASKSAEDAKAAVDLQIVDDATGTKYQFGAVNGVIYLKEV